LIAEVFLNEEVLEDLGLDGRIMLKWISKNWGGGHGLETDGGLL
jgi:hypothetical protein